MKDRIGKISETIFIKGDLRTEEGEVRRAAAHFGRDADAFTGEFMRAYESGVLVSLTPSLWEQLDNTDADSVEMDDWNKVAENARMAGRDWETLKDKMERGMPLDAPIILRYASKLHLVSGNTRLMVARALGLKPQVVLVRM